LSGGVDVVSFALFVEITVFVVVLLVVVVAEAIVRVFVSGFALVFVVRWSCCCLPLVYPHKRCLSLPPKGYNILTVPVRRREVEWGEKSCQLFALSCEPGRSMGGTLPIGPMMSSGAPTGWKRGSTPSPSGHAAEGRSSLRFDLPYML